MLKLVNGIQKCNRSNAKNVLMLDSEHNNQKVINATIW
jgi:hypothetical protein